MLTMLKDYTGQIEINGILYESISEALKNADFEEFSNVCIRLHASKKHAENTLKRANTSVSVSNDRLDYAKQYRFTVKQYMTKEGSPDFDFMTKWNNDVPMPFRTMIGTIEKETRGMIYVHLHADIYAPTIRTCMKCGRPLTNKISQYFGVGPECGGHNYVNPFNSDKELTDAVESYRKELNKITWDGWIIKSAITDLEEIV